VIAAAAAAAAAAKRAVVLHLPGMIATLKGQEAAKRKTGREESKEDLKTLEE